MNYTVNNEPYRMQAGVLAFVVHGAFFALLYFGFTWQVQPVKSVSVELWQSLPSPKPVAVAQPVVNTPPPAPRPTPVVKAPPHPPPPPVVKAEIALPDKKKQVEPKRPEVKPEPPKVVPPVVKKTPEPKPPKPVDANAEPKVNYTALREAAVRQMAAEREDDERKAIAERQAAAERQIAKERADQANAIGKVVDEYIAKIQSKVRHNIVEPPNVDRNARAEFRVTLLPGGNVMSVKLSKSSGNAAYDNAVERAIYKADPLPLPSDTSLFNRFRELKLGIQPTE